MAWEIVIAAPAALKVADTANDVTGDSFDAIRRATTKAINDGFQIESAHGVTPSAISGSWIRCD